MEQEWLLQRVFEALQIEGIVKIKWRLFALTVPRSKFIRMEQEL